MEIACDVTLSPSMLLPLKILCPKWQAEPKLIEIASDEVFLFSVYIDEMEQKYFSRRVHFLNVYLQIARISILKVFLASS